MLGLNVKGLLDCGASCSVMGKDCHKIFENIGIPVQTHDTPFLLRVANGNTLTCTQFMTLPIEYKEKLHMINFDIQPDITTPLIFGLNFWKAFRLAPEIIASITDKEFQIDSTKDTPMESGLQTLGSLTDLQRKEIDKIKALYDQVNTVKVGLGKTHLIEHEINTGDSHPIKQRYFRLSPSKQAALERELDRMLEEGIVEPSHSPWNSPVVMVEKSNGSLRLCLDSRKINSVSKADAYPLPYVNYILDNLRDAKYLSSLDLSAAYHQIPLSENSKEKTAFTVPGRGLFHYNRMCFGLVGASATMQRLMDQLFTAEYDNKVFCYVDDIIISTSDFDEHARLLKAVLDKLKAANLTVNMEKSLFCRPELKYLGYVVDRYGLRTDPSKVEVIMNFPTPVDPKEVKRFLGMAGWYRRFIENFSKIARPLTRLTSKKNKFMWSEEAEASFNQLKTALVSAPILRCPEFSQPFYIHTDASSYAVGAVLTQRVDDVDHPIAYCSRTLNNQEVNYSATERELLAVIYALEQYRAYVEGRKCYIISDHASLQWFTKLKNPTGRLNRWACRLSQFNFELIHRKGKEHVIPDTLSRIHLDALFEVEDIQDPWYKDLHKAVSEYPIRYANYKIENGQLLRLSKNKYNVTSQCDWKIVVPYEARAEVLRSCHDDPTAGHFGVAKTHKRIAGSYYWPTLFQDVKDYVDSCETCKTYKPVNLAPGGMMGNPRRITRPAEAISCDILGPFPPSYARYQYLFVCTDYFSKFVTLFPLRTVTSRAIIKCLEKGIFLVHGTPKYVYVDNGPQFISKEFRDCMLKYNVPHVFYNPRYHPQTNQTERVNRELVRAIASYVSNDHRTWDQNLSEIQCALNTAVHEGTKFSPYFLMHGREMVIDGTLYNSPNPANRNIIEDIDFGFTESLKDLKSIFSKVRKSLLAAHTRNAKYYNMRRRPVEFQEGQIIYKRCFPLSNAGKHFSAKLAPKYEKCVIHKKLSPLVYNLKSLSGKCLGDFHIKDLVRPGETSPNID